MENIFRPCEILVPQGCDMEKWSVVACDQYSAQPEYWDGLDRMIGDAPSTLRMILPEAYLGREDHQERAGDINAVMRSYLDSGLFRPLENSFIYVERTLDGGAVRKGLLGALDLEAYDYSPDSLSPVRATEGTVPERLPPRVKVRREAPLEMPHILIFLDDPADTAMGPLTEMKAEMEPLFDFALNGGGGHLRTWRVSGGLAEKVSASVNALSAAGEDKPVFAIGDGNHSLAAAKNCWEEIKPRLSPQEREKHPARFSLVELVNIHDPGISFEPIHRVLFDTDTGPFFREAEAFWRGNGLTDSGGHILGLISCQQRGNLSIEGHPIGRLIALAEEFCRFYVEKHGGRIDYIHNDSTALAMGSRPGSAGLLLPRMEKGELFPSIQGSGPFPKKSFSIGRAQDKRYYLECRKITV